MYHIGFKTNIALSKNIKLLNKQVQTRFLASNITPVKLAYSVYEDPTKTYEKPPFVIVHGLFGSKQNWTSLCKEYHKKIKPPRKVIALDLRNHGNSEHTEEHSYLHLAEDIKQFLTDSDIKKITLMGHSMGGKCAMAFALFYPDILEKLIVVDMSPVSVSPTLNYMPKMLHAMQGVEMPQKVPLSQARKLVDEQLLEEIPDKDVRAFILTNLVPMENESYQWRINISTLIETFHELAKFPDVKGLQFKGSTLFIGGENSDFLPKLKHKFLTINLAKAIRCSSDLAQNENDKSIIDLAYASYQSTDAILGKLTAQEIPTPLIILHGILGSKSNFNSLCQRYHEDSKPKRLVFAVDLRNHGDSAHIKDNSYDDMVMDLVKFISTMNLKKVSLLGHDVGGRVGMLLCLKYPETVHKLIVSDISPITTSNNFQAFPEILRNIHNLSFPPNLTVEQAKAHVASSLSRVVKCRGLMSLILANLVPKSDGSYSWLFNSSALLEHFRELSSFPNVHNVNFQGPVLFVGGAKSDYIQKSDFPKIREWFPNAELKYIQGAGHWVHAEKPSEFLKITMDFLNKNV